MGKHPQNDPASEQSRDANLNSNSSSVSFSWPDVAISLIDNLATASFSQVLFDSINKIAPIDSSVVMLFRQNNVPLVLSDHLHPVEESSFYQSYLGGAYLLSPLYQRITTLRSGFYRLGDLDSHRFEHSDFAKAYFNQSGLSDDANYVYKIDSESAIVASFGRQQLSSSFSQDELRQLHIAEPLFRSAMARHWGHELGGNQSLQAESSHQHNHLKGFLKRFASSALSEREQMVLQLMLDGKPSKISARVLSITTDTERGHRKKIYAKLGVVSQAQLFSLVLTVLGSVDADYAGDPYSRYLETHDS